MDKIIEKDNTESFKINKYLTLTPCIFTEKKKKISTVMKKYNFEKDAIISILDKLGIDRKATTYDYTGATKMAILLMLILLKNNKIILFYTAGLSYSTSQRSYQFLYDKIRNTDKIGLVLELSRFETIEIIKMKQEIIDNYPEWIKPQIGDTRPSLPYRDK